MADFTLDPDYIEVSDRIAAFYDAYPEGRLCPLNEAKPFRVHRIDDRTFVSYVAAAYKHKDDLVPSGVGSAWEPFPGTTPFTRNSELMNAETSAWGRAIVACGASRSKHIASANEVRNRSGESVVDTVVINPKVDIVSPHLSAAQSLTEKQNNAIYAILRGKGENDVDEHLKIISKILNRTVGRDGRMLIITKKEAGIVIDALNTP